MNISYKKILNNNKLVLSDFKLNGFSENYLLKMLVNNNISGLLPTELSMINSIPTLSYDITAKHSVLSLTENKKIDFALFYFVMQGLHKLCTTLESFMLDSCYLLLSPEYIFLDGNMSKIYFCYCPISEADVSYSFTQQLKIFLEYAISRLNYDDKSCVAHVYFLHQKCVEDTLCLEDLLYSSSEQNDAADDDNFSQIPPKPNIEYTDYSDDFKNNSNIKNDGYNEPSDNIFISENPLSNICGFPALSFAIFAALSVLAAVTFFCGLYLYFVRGQSLPASAFVCMSGPIILLLYIPSLLKKRKKEIQNDNFLNPVTEKEPVNRDFSDCIMPVGETVLISGDFLADIPRLVYSGTDCNEDIKLNDFPFTIGKLPNSSDFVIENPLISRIHARFYLKEGCYYIEDLNSSNGTYINNIPLSPHTMTEVHSGDFITFARLTYVFKLC